MAGSVLHVYTLMTFSSITPFTPHMTSCHSSLILIESQHGHVQISLPSLQQVQVHGSVLTTVSLLSSHTTYKKRDHLLEKVMSFKYLGVNLSCDLSWSLHIQTLTSRARKVVGLLYQTFYNFSPPAVLLRLYLSLVRPLLEYASVVWSPYLKKDIL